jgi:two-component system, chemotaxis family, chemotaxis protein CheY
MLTKVLVVDDSSFMRTMIKNIVKQKNAEVIEASSADEAVEKYKAEKPDLVFMDIIMEGKTGLDALKEIRESDENAIVIMCTSIGGQEHVIKEAVDYGAADFMTKPFKQQEIFNVLEKYGN